MNRTTAFVLTALALMLGVTTDVLFRGYAIGANAPLNLALLLVAAAFAAGPDRLRRVDRFDWWLAPGALVFAGFLAIRADPVLALINVAGAAALTAGFLVTLAGNRITRAALSSLLVLPFDLAIAATGGAVPVIAATRPAPGAAGRLRRAPNGLAAVFRGLLIAGPILVVFGGLFAAADAVFANAAGEVLSLPFRLPVGDLAEHGAWVALVAWVMAGLLALAAGVLPSVFGTAAPEADGSAPPAAGTPASPAAGSPGLGRIETLVVLLGLDLLFGAFVALQVAYLFGGHDGMTAAGFTYAEYARRGFFELLAAAALVAALVATVEWLVPDGSRLRRAASAALLGLTLVVLVSSFLRLRLYQEAYGWTELRFWVLLSIGWLAASLVAMGALVVARRSSRIVHAAVLLGLAAVLVADVAAPQRVVAEQNLARALDPSLVAPGGREVLDDGYLAALGLDAVPVVAAALPRLPPATRAPLEAQLLDRARELADDPAFEGWPAWNLAREEARAALTNLLPQ